MTELSTKPYLIRAIYEWCADSSFTPYLNVKVDQNTRVPMEYVKNGEIVLSMSQQATRNLTIGNELIQFSARFNGISREITIPIYAVQSVFARENGRGVFSTPKPPRSKPLRMRQLLYLYQFCRRYRRQAHRPHPSLREIRRSMRVAPHRHPTSRKHHLAASFA